MICAFKVKDGMLDMNTGDWTEFLQGLPALLK
jgi:hypothetical protein